MTAASTIRDVHGVSRMTAPDEHYRIRMGDYRLGITIDREMAVLRRFLPRGEIYAGFREGYNGRAVIGCRRVCRRIGISAHNFRRERSVGK